jgi:hypothetical protein
MSERGVGVELVATPATCRSEAIVSGSASVAEHMLDANEL